MTGTRPHHYLLELQLLLLGGLLTVVILRHAATILWLLPSFVSLAMIGLGLTGLNRLYLRVRQAGHYYSGDFMIGEALPSRVFCPGA